MLPFSFRDHVKAGLNTRDDNNYLEKDCFRVQSGAING